jgi:hypothetical protein
VLAYKLNPLNATYVDMSAHLYTILHGGCILHLMLLSGINSIRGICRGGHV